MRFLKYLVPLVLTACTSEPDGLMPSSLPPLPEAPEGALVGRVLHPGGLPAEGGLIYGLEASQGSLLTRTDENGAFIVEDPPERMLARYEFGEVEFFQNWMLEPVDVRLRWTVDRPETLDLRGIGMEQSLEQSGDHHVDFYVTDDFVYAIFEDEDEVQRVEELGLRSDSQRLLLQTDAKVSLTAFESEFVLLRSDRRDPQTRQLTESRFDLFSLSERQILVSTEWSDTGTVLSTTLDGQRLHILGIKGFDHQPQLTHLILDANRGVQDYLGQLPLTGNLVCVAGSSGPNTVFNANGRFQVYNVLDRSGYLLDIVPLDPTQCRELTVNEFGVTEWRYDEEPQQLVRQTSVATDVWQLNLPPREGDEKRNLRFEQRGEYVMVTQSLSRHHSVHLLSTVDGRTLHVSAIPDFTPEVRVQNFTLDGDAAQLTFVDGNSQVVRANWHPDRGFEVQQTTPLPAERTNCLPTRSATHEALFGRHFTCDGDSPYGFEQSEVFRADGTQRTFFGVEPAFGDNQSRDFAVYPRVLLPLGLTSFAVDAIR